MSLPDAVALPSKLPPVAAYSTFCEQQLRSLIQERTGIVLQDHQRDNLRQAVAEACETYQYRGCEEYLAALRDGPKASEITESLITSITVGETYFFRDSRQFALLRDKLLPELIESRRKSGEFELRIWSAGCAMGQEIYSIAMLLEDLLPKNEKWVLHLLGTDINPVHLAQAIRGRFRQWSFRVTPEDVKASYFSKIGPDEYEILPRIRKSAKFAYLNLAADAFPSILTETFALDLILCRNVFIYLAPDVTAAAMDRFAKCLLPGGALLLGPSDFVDWPKDALDLVQGVDVGHFRRRDWTQELEFPTLVSNTVRPNKVGDAPAVRRKTGKAARLNKVGGAPAARRTADNAPKPSAAPPPSSPRKTKTSHRVAPVVSSKSAAADQEIIDLLSAERWRDVLLAVERVQRDFGETASRLRMTATAQANLGQLPEALEACEASLALDSTEKHTWFLMGSVHVELGHLQEAEDALRRTLYLDRGFLEAHYNLGLLLMRSGNANSGLKSLRNALRLVERGDPEHEVHSGLGMTFRQLAEVLRNEIEIFEQVGAS
jgi:chemotaxis protein methyltransferase CheR